MQTYRLPRENLRALDYRKLGPLFKYVIGNLMYTFGSTNAQKGKPLLVTVGASNYCEKARWALDLSPLKNEYREDAHAPAMHTFQVNWVTNYTASRTPVLVLPDKSVIMDSTKILHYLQDTYPEQCGYLYPEGISAEVSEYEEYLGTKLGPVVRQYGYTHMIANTNRPDNTVIYNWMSGWMTQQSSSIERRLFFSAQSTLINMLKKGMGLEWNNVTAMTESIDEVFDKVNHTLSDGRSFLFGEQMTAADISFAALAYPALIPPEMNDVVPVMLAPKEVAIQLDEYVKQAMKWQKTPAGELALRLYRDHRFNDGSTMVKWSRNR
eukprot:CFRG7189T1